MLGCSNLFWGGITHHSFQRANQTFYHVQTLEIFIRGYLETGQDRFHVVDQHSQASLNPLWVSSGESHTAVTASWKAW